MSLSDIIAPPVFYFDGKPYEMNAAGIYIPIGDTFFKDTSGNLISSQQAAALLAKHKADFSAGSFAAGVEFSGLADSVLNSKDAYKIMKAAWNKFASNVGHVSWNPIADSSIHPKHLMLDTGSLFSSLATPIYPPNYLGAINAYKASIQSLYGPSPLAGLVSSLMAARRRFICEHDDSHLFTREPTKKCTDAFDEQCVLRGLHGGGEYVWSEVLQSHVRLA